MRAVASITEAMLVSIMVAVIVAVSFTYFAGYYSALNPRIEYKKLDVVVCGNVITMKNVGDAPVKIEGLWGIYYRPVYARVSVEVDWLALGYVLKPGETRNIVAPKPYAYIIVKTVDARLDPVKNSCVEAGEPGERGAYNDVRQA